MKKKSIALISVCLILIVFCAFAVACDNKGLSAYDLAVQNGFKGTLEEWLESLKGADGIDGETGAPGKDGEDGKDGVNGWNGIDGQDVSVEDLYNKAVENGFKGDFLAFLKEYLSLDINGETVNVSDALLASVKIMAYYKYITGGTLFQPEQEISAVSNGSGVIYKLNKEIGEAYIITNYHVVANDSATKETATDGIINDIYVYLYGTQNEMDAIAAQYVGGSFTYDIAVLKIKENDVIKDSAAKQVAVENSDNLTVGSEVMAIGNAAAQGISVTKGVISVDSEVITVADGTGINAKRSSHRVIRVDAAINSGNSGGGLFDSQGRLIGIVNAKSNSTAIENMGYAIPSNIATAVADSIIDNCDKEDAESKKLSRITLGVSLTVESSRAVYDANTLSVKIVEDVAISNVTAGGAADGKLLEGDVVKSISINGIEYKIERTFTFIDAMLKVRIGDTIVVNVVRVVEEELPPTEPIEPTDGTDVTDPSQPSTGNQTIQKISVTIEATEEFFSEIE